MPTLGFLRVKRDLNARENQTRDAGGVVELCAVR